MEDQKPTGDGAGRESDPREGEPLVEAIEADFWQTAYAEHATSVKTFLERRLGRREEAEDLLQETFVRAIRADSFQAGGNLRAYLLRIARNLLINRFRRPRLVVAAEPPPTGGDAFDQVADRQARSPEESTALSDFERRLRQALMEMKPAHRRAFELGVLEGQSYREVAESTGWSVGQVKINVYRARRKLLEELGDDFAPRPRSST